MDRNNKKWRKKIIDGEKGWKAESGERGKGKGERKGRKRSEGTKGRGIKGK